MLLGMTDNCFGGPQRTRAVIKLACHNRSRYARSVITGLDTILKKLPTEPIFSSSPATRGHEQTIRLATKSWGQQGSSQEIEERQND